MRIWPPLVASALPPRICLKRATAFSLTSWQSMVCSEFYKLVYEFSIILWRSLAPFRPLSWADAGEYAFHHLRRRLHTLDLLVPLIDIYPGLHALLLHAVNACSISSSAHASCSKTRDTAAGRVVMACNESRVNGNSARRGRRGEHLQKSHRTLLPTKSHTPHSATLSTSPTPPR